uniref:Sesquipedalian n=3 Tax=Oryzias melastigma TaxID=30732 RepID=A0A3B3CQW7_ORYME
MLIYEPNRFLYIFNMAQNAIIFILSICYETAVNQFLFHYLLFAGAALCPPSKQTRKQLFSISLEDETATLSRRRGLQRILVCATQNVEMKVDEKALGYFQSCDSPVDKEGYLYKKGEIKTSYQKRWFVLKGNLLFYKERSADRDVSGVIVLEGCTVQLCESEEQFAFSLVWSEPGLRTYKFAAEDQESQESWIKALLSANHSYLALLVQDMENKYKDALAELSGKPNQPSTTPNLRADAQYSAAVLSTRSSTLSMFPAQAAGAGLGPLVPPSATLPSASKRSPKLWPKRSANLVSHSTPAMPTTDWVEYSSGPVEDFRTLHEDFGKEVKKLITEWARRKGLNIHVNEDLINFG